MTTSVALCTYNGEEFLSAQLDSILNQTVLPKEIVICDDISTDATFEIVSCYQKNYPFIKLFRNEENLGFIKNFEKAIYLCTQDVIIICDQDDIWEADKIQQTIDFLGKNKHCDGVFHDLKLIDENAIKPSYLNWKNISHADIIQDIAEGKLFSSLVSKGSFILGCSLAIRKEALSKYQIKDFPFAHDLFIAQKLSAFFALGFIPKALSSYRLHENQVYGLRYKSPHKEPEILTEKNRYFNEFVWPNLIIVQKYEEIAPNHDVKQSQFFATFIQYRNAYLQSLNFVERKIYIAKCIRYDYLYLTLPDLFKI